MITVALKLITTECRFSHRTSDECQFFHSSTLRNLKVAVMEWTDMDSPVDSWGVKPLDLAVTLDLSIIYTALNILLSQRIIPISLIII